MFWRTNKAAVHASYAIALHVANTKKPHNIGETLLKPCILESVKLVLGEKASQTMKQISLSNDTIKSRIHEMSDNIKSKVLSKIDSSPVFALQLDESIDISNLSQLLVYVRDVADERINEEFLFCRFYITLKFAGCQKGNMLSRIFELREEVKLFLVAKQKHDLLLAFGGDGFFTYLAYLADIFEVLN